MPVTILVTVEILGRMNLQKIAMSMIPLMLDLKGLKMIGSLLFQKGVPFWILKEDRYLATSMYIFIIMRNKVFQF